MKTPVIVASLAVVIAGCGAASTPGTPGVDPSARPSHAECVKWSDQMIHLVLEEGKKQGIAVDDAKKQAAKAEMDEMIPTCEADLTVGQVDCVLKATSVDSARVCDD